MEFLEYTRKSNDKNSVWQYYLRSKGGQEAQCKHCKSILKISGSTSTLRNHLLKKHFIDLKNKEVAEEVTASCSTSVGSPNKKLKLADYLINKDSFRDVISRLVVMDGLPLKILCSSDDLRKLLQKSFEDNIPKSPNTIKNIVMDVYKRERSDLISEIKVMKSKGTKFVITFDEWTSIRSHRYLNVNIHYRDVNDENVFKNLGLVRIVGSMNAEACIVLLELRLDSFKLSLQKDIVGSTTDGAALMVKVGRTMPVPIHQLCFAHGIQLAVLDVLYKNASQPTTLPEEAEITLDSTSEESDGEFDDGFTIENSRQRGSLIADYKNIIKKVRSVVNIFKNSPTKNDDVLQKYVKLEHGKELSLLLDCRTRWSSLALMLDRFLKLYSAIQKSLIDINSDIKFTDIEIFCLQNLQTCLDMFKATVEVLCRRDATILTADVALQLLIKSLLSHGTATGKNLANALCRRIKERRLHIVVGTLEYLQNPNQFLNRREEQDNDDEYKNTFIKPSYEEIKKMLYQVVTMDEQDCNTTNVDCTSETLPDEPDIQPSPVSFKDKLNSKIASLTSTAVDNHQNQPSTSSSSCTDYMTLLNVEMALYESGGGCGNIMKKAYKRLQTIPPTSVESERAFSTAGTFSNKLRSRLSDETLDAFMFLRSRFLDIKNKQRKN